MSVQTSYSLYPPIGYPGLIYGCFPNDIGSFTAETDSGIGFGLAASRGIGDTGIVRGGDNPFGITLRSLEREGVYITSEIRFKKHETVALLRKGYVWAVCVSGCNVGDVVKSDTITGALSAGDPSGATDAALKNATWETSAAVGEIAVVRIA